MKLLIAGAGIGGLTAALALQAKGMDVELLEAATALDEVGAGLQLGANAVHVLHALGLALPLRDLSFAPEAMHMRDYRSGRPITDMAFGEAYQARYGAPFLQIHRGDLHGLLMNALIERAGEVIRTGQKVRRYQQTKNGVIVTSESGETFEADALIGADGVRSAIRAQMFGQGTPRFTGHVAWRGVLSADRLRGLDLPPVVTSWVAPHAHAVTYFLRRGELFNFVGITENNQWTDESWRAEASPQQLQAAFSDWHPDIQQIVAQIERPFRWALYTHSPLAEWSKGRVTLLGDACHPMLPYMAQGAGMAIEDAFVLADCLANDTPEKELQTYQSRRMARTARMQATSEQNGRIFHQSGVMRLGLHAGMKLAGAVVPDLVARRFDWIYQHDVTKSLS